MSFGRVCHFKFQCNAAGFDFCSARRRPRKWSFGTRWDLGLNGIQARFLDGCWFLDPIFHPLILFNYDIGHGALVYKTFFIYSGGVNPWVKDSVCFVLKFALPPYSPPLPSGVQISTQNTSKPDNEERSREDIPSEEARQIC